MHSLAINNNINFSHEMVKEILRRMLAMSVRSLSESLDATKEGLSNTRLRKIKIFQKKNSTLNSYENTDYYCAPKSDQCIFFGEHVENSKDSLRREILEFGEQSLVDSRVEIGVQNIKKFDSIIDKYYEKYNSKEGNSIEEKFDAFSIDEKNDLIAKYISKQIEFWNVIGTDSSFTSDYSHEQKQLALSNVNKLKSIWTKTNFESIISNISGEIVSNDDILSLFHEVKLELAIERAIDKQIKVAIESPTKTIDNKFDLEYINTLKDQITDGTFRVDEPTNDGRIIAKLDGFNLVAGGSELGLRHILARHTKIEIPEIEAYKHKAKTSLYPENMNLNEIFNIIKYTAQNCEISSKSGNRYTNEIYSVIGELNFDFNSIGASLEKYGINRDYGISKMKIIIINPVFNEEDKLIGGTILSAFPTEGNDVIVIEREGYYEQNRL